MWLPLSSRKRCFGAIRSAVSANKSLQAPAALTRIARRHHVALAAGIEHEPPYIGALGAHAAGAGADHRAALGGIDRIEHDEARVIGKAIGIFEGMMEARFERLAGFVGHQIELARPRQNLAPADPVVDEEAEPQHRRRASRLVDRQHEAQRPDQMRRRAQQHFAFAQGGVHQAEFDAVRDNAGRHE